MECTTYGGRIETCKIARFEVKHVTIIDDAELIVLGSNLANWVVIHNRRLMHRLHVLLLAVQVLLIVTFLVTYNFQHNTII